MNTFINLLSATSGSIGASILGSCAWRLHIQKDEKFLSHHQRNQIETKMQELAKKLGLSKPIELIEISGCAGIAQAQGINIFSGKIGIAIDPLVVRDLPEEQIEFLLSHELSHIKANDYLWLGLSSAVGAITTLGISKLFPSSSELFPKSVIAVTKAASPAAAAGLAASAVALSLISKWREENADKLGFYVCSDTAKKGAVDLFKTIKAAQIEYRNADDGSSLSKAVRKCSITEDGNSRTDFMHPKLQERISYLEPLSESAIGAVQ